VGRWLREADARVGLRRWEQVGCLSLLMILWLARYGHPRLRVLGMALLVGFLRLLGTRYAWRELGFVRQAAPLPARGGRRAPGGGGRFRQQDVQLGVPTLERSATVFAHPSHLTGRLRRRPLEEPRDASASGDLPALHEWTAAPSPDVDRAAAHLVQLSSADGLSRFGEISCVPGFAQSVTYASDAETTGNADYWRFPVETLYEQTGDCEDSSILAAAVLRRLGRRVTLAMTSDHVALGVEAPPGTPGHFVLVEGRRMYYCETTAAGCQVGELPDGVDAAQLRWVPL